MDSSLLILDATQCVECDLCSLACSLTKTGEANVKISRVRSIKKWPEFPDLNVCRHWKCDGQPCIHVCPTEAIELDDGVLFVDSMLCNGCGECVPVCPFGAIHISELDWKAYACDLCGGSPACVPACPTDALLFKGNGHAK
ncbi:MAG: 4Fe-4S dicluster domain-containing protein [Chloroflexi bacterium]|nr:4Fe-4S dicluster domain-containing protein [Chloroflexota bacterium]